MVSLQRAAIVFIAQSLFQFQCAVAKDAVCPTANDGVVCGEGGTCVAGKCFCSEKFRHSTYTGEAGFCVTNPSKFAVYKSLCLAGCLLLLGKILRMTVPLFQKTFLPASIIAGLGFFTFLTIMFYANKDFHRSFTFEYTEGWNKIGAFSVDVLFGSLFLGTEIPAPSEIIAKAGPQFLYNQLINWGMWLVSCLVVSTICVTLLDSHVALATLIPAGFTGGHAIIFALADDLKDSDFTSGVAIGLYISTLGQVFSFVLGVAWINMAVARGLCPARPSPAQESEEDKAEAKLFAQGLFAPENMPSAGKLTCSPDSMDVLTLHASIVMLVMMIGITCYEATNETMKGLGIAIQRFVWCMFWGILFQIVYERLVRAKCIPPLLDPQIMGRLQGILLDFLIVTAMSTVSIDDVLPQIFPATLACVIVLIWLGVATWYIAPYFLPDHHFERAICEYGQTTGVISSGLILLKMCDPQQKLPVMDSFALKNFAAMPLMFTFLPLTIPIATAKGPDNIVGLLIISGIAVGVLAVCISVWYFYYRPRYANMNFNQDEEGTTSVELTDKKRKSLISNLSRNFA